MNAQELLEALLKLDRSQRENYQIFAGDADANVYDIVYFTVHKEDEQIVIGLELDA